MEEGLNPVLKKFVNRRKGHRAAVTTKIRGLQKLLAETEIDEAKILSVKGVLSEKLDLLRDLNEKILELIETSNTEEDEDDTVSKEISDCTDWEDKIFEALCKIDLTVEKLRGANDSDHSASSRNSRSSEFKGKSNIKLPKIHLKKFQGDLKQ